MKRKNAFGLLFAIVICFACAPVAANAAQKDNSSKPASPSPQTTVETRQTISGPYRLTYTLSDMDGSRKVGSQRYAIVLNADGLKNSLNLGTKIPIETAAPGADSPIPQMQISYIDTGVSIHVCLRQFANGLELQNRVVQSAVDSQQSLLKTPIIRQALLDTTVLINEDKPLTLGTVGMPGTTHILQIQVELTKVP